MKFGVYIKNQMIPEWQCIYDRSEAYVNYAYLKYLLKPFKKFKKNYLFIFYEEHPGIQICNTKTEYLEQLQAFANRFVSIIQREVQKVNTFFEFKMLDCIQKWKQVKLNTVILSGDNKHWNFKDHLSKLKKNYSIFLKEIHYLIQYAHLNLDGIRKICKKYNKLCDILATKKVNYQKIKDISENTMIQKNVYQIQVLQRSVETYFIDTFFKKCDKKVGQKELLKIREERKISQLETFFFGTFMGCAIVVAVAIVVISWYGNVKQLQQLSFQDDDVFASIFPMFRGAGLFILYLALLGFNVYGWTMFNINYKLILGFNYHYSQYYIILKRVAFFSIVLFLSMLAYLLLHLGIVFYDNDYENYIPALNWLCLIVYCFFPSTKYFNYEGRHFVWKIFKKVISNPWAPALFSDSFIFSNMESLRIPIQDLEYTLCFYAFQNDREYCQNRGGRISSGLIVALIVPSIRFIQCMRQCYDLKSLNNSRFVSGFKYFSNMLLTFLSFLLFFNEEIFPIWLIWAFFLTIYSHFCDLYLDYGFLEKDSPNFLLRKDLQYPHKWYYYLAMVMNLFLRSIWMLTISPEAISYILDKLKRNEIVLFFVAFTEMLRRCMWNFLKMEIEHVKNVNSFKAVENLDLPIKNFKYNVDEMMLVLHEFQQELQEDTQAVDDKNGFTQKLRRIFKHRSKNKTQDESLFIKLTKYELEKKFQDKKEHQELVRQVDDFVKDMYSKLLNQFYIRQNESSFTNDFNNEIELVNNTSQLRVNFRKDTLSYMKKQTSQKDMDQNMDQDQKKQQMKKVIIMKESDLSMSHEQKSQEQKREIKNIYMKKSTSSKELHQFNTPKNTKKEDQLIEQKIV